MDFMIAIAALILAGPASAQDLVTLLNGNQVEGRIAAENEEGVEVLVPSGRLRLRRDDIQKTDASRPFERYVGYGWALLKKKDFSQAETVYREGIEKFDQDPEKKKLLELGLLEAGQGLLGQRRFGDARRVFDALLEADPEHPEGRRLAEETNRACRRIGREIEGYRKAIEADPDNDHARYQLGLRQESLGRVEEAREQYLAIVSRYPQVQPEQFNGRLDLLRGFIQKHMVVTGPGAEAAESDSRYKPAMPGGWERHSSSRVVILHHQADLAREAAAVAENLLPRLETEYGLPEDSEPYTIWIYRDEAEYVQATGRAGTLGFCEEARKVLLYQTAPRLLRSVLPHELAHATLYRRYRRIPSWLDEGLAVRQEWGCELYYDRTREWIDRGAAFSLVELFRKNAVQIPKEQREIFYGQAFTLVDYLDHEQGGRERLLQLLEALSSGKELAPSLQTLYRIPTLLELEKLWKRYVEL
ncbi:MAG: tetratricopeptide repeat protein [Planctomycetes bacterium]|nr:tetratricopeptide repeat protein [Planctomycetota bacterium]